MQDIERIVALERELEDTRRAAVKIVLAMVDSVGQTPDQREELARGFAQVVTGNDPIMARLAWVMAQAIRREGRHPPDDGGTGPMSDG